MSSDDPLVPGLPFANRSMGSRLRDQASRLVQTRSFWALADQAIASVSNFATLILLGRCLPTSTYGAFSIVWELLIFLNSLHAALIVYPVTVRGTRLDLDHLRQLTTIGLVLTALLAVPLGGAVFVMGAWQGLLIGVFAATALAAFQIHETLRRSLISHFLYREAIWGDAVAYLGMAGVVVSLAALNRLTIPLVFAAMTITFSLASLVQALRLRPGRLSSEQIKPVAAEFWTLGRWMLASNLTAVTTTLGVQWCVALFHEMSEVGKLTAVGNLIRFTNPLMTAMSGLIVPAVAREGNIRPGIRYTLLGLAILTPYFLVLFFAPGFSIWVFYGQNPEYQDSSMELRVSVIACVTGYLGAMLLAILMGLGNSKANFYAQVITSIASITIVLPLSIKWGWSGALVGSMIACTVTFVTAIYLLHRQVRASGRSDGIADRPT